MINLSIENKRFFFKRRQIYLLPENWNEITQEQLIENIEMLSVFFFEKSEKTKIILNITEYYRQKIFYNFIRNKKIFKVSLNIVKQITDLLNWLVTGEKILNNFIIKQIKVNKSILYGPNDKFLYMTFGEFIFADTMFSHFHLGKDETFLNKLIAILFRAKKHDESHVSFNGDIRIQFNDAKIDYDSIAITKLNTKIKAAILFNYHTMRKYLSEKYIYVFGNYKKQEDNNEEKETKSNTSTWNTILKRMSPNILDIDKYANQPMHTVLDFLNTSILNDMNK